MWRMCEKNLLSRYFRSYAESRPANFCCFCIICADQSRIKQQKERMNSVGSDEIVLDL